MSNLEPALGQGIILCDSFIREEGTGKLSLIGSFQNFNFPVFPFQVPSFCAVVLITNLSGQIDRLTITVRVEIPSSGHVVANASMQIGFKKAVDKDEIFELPFRLPPSQFPSAGIYQLVVLVNNERLGHKDFRVNPITESPQIQ